LNLNKILSNSGLRARKGKTVLKYMGPLIAVYEIAPSRYFYEHLLGQKVKFDFGQNVQLDETGQPSDG
jgi:hypothetical protein